jgi:hypothetical protein
VVEEREGEKSLGVEGKTDKKDPKGRFQGHPYYIINKCIHRLLHVQNANQRHIQWGQIPKYSAITILLSFFHSIHHPYDVKTLDLPLVSLAVDENVLATER